MAFGTLRGVDLNHRPLGYEPEGVMDNKHLAGHGWHRWTYLDSVERLNDPSLTLNETI